MKTRQTKDEEKVAHNAKRRLRAPPPSGEFLARLRQIIFQRIQFFFSSFHFQALRKKLFHNVLGFYTNVNVFLFSSENKHRQK